MFNIYCRIVKSVPWTSTKHQIIWLLLVMMSPFASMMQQMPRRVFFFLSNVKITREAIILILLNESWLYVLHHTLIIATKTNYLSLIFCHLFLSCRCLKTINSKKYGVDLVCFTSHPTTVIYSSKNGWDGMAMFALKFLFAVKFLFLFFIVQLRWS